MDPVISEPHTQYGAYALCVMVVGILGFTIKQLLATLSSNLSEMRASIDSLPCKSGMGCRMGEHHGTS